MEKAVKSAEAFRTISEVSEILDVPQHVLRFWEGKFSQIKPMKRGGNRRYYRPEDLELLRAISHLLYTDGYTIKGVQKLLRENGVRATVNNHVAQFGAFQHDGTTAPPLDFSDDEVLDLETVEAELEEPASGTLGLVQADPLETKPDSKAVEPEDASASPLSLIDDLSGPASLPAGVLAGRRASSGPDLDALSKEAIERIVMELKQIRSLLDAETTGSD